MSAKILYGKEFAAQIKESARVEVENIKNKFNVTPGLAVIIVGENPASQVYVRNKHKTCEELGIKSEVVEMPASTTKDEKLTPSTLIKIFTEFWYSCRCLTQLKHILTKF